MIKIKFKHQYLKLRSEIFPTTRGKSWIKKIKPDQNIIIEDFEDYKFEGLVIDVYLKQLSLLSESFIRIDGSYEKNYKLYQIKTHGEFLELLNSFRKPVHQLGLFDQVCIIWLAKLESLS